MIGRGGRGAGAACQALSTKGPVKWLAMATYSGKMINWQQAINSEVSLAPERYAWDAKPPVLPGADGSYPVAMPGITKVL